VTGDSDSPIFRTPPFCAPFALEGEEKSKELLMLYFYIYIYKYKLSLSPFSTQRGVAEFWTVTVTCHQVSKETEGFSSWHFVFSSEKFGVFKSKA